MLANRLISYLPLMKGFAPQGLRAACILALMLLGFSAVSAEPTADDPVPVSEAIKQAVAEEIYSIGLVNVEASELVFRPSLDMNDVYETIIGAYVFQISSDASMLLRGDLFYTDEGELLDAKQRATVRRNTLALLDEKDMINYPATGKTQHHLSAFIDVDCEYCARLHHDIPRLNAAGVHLRFLAFPREGLDTPNFLRTVSVWCSSDRAAALERLEAGHSIPSRSCPNPVAAHFYLGEAFRVEGTPTLVLSDGHMQPGYPGFKPLLQLLEQHQHQTP